MSYDPGNPYSSPLSQPPDPRNQVKGKVMAPAIALMVVAGLGLLGSLVNIVMAMGEPPAVDPNMPEWLQQMQQGQVGPFAIAVQSLFAVVNVVILLGGVMMLRMQSWTMSMVGTILAMVNIGTCCCVLGLPIGIWSLVVLLAPDVKAAFAAGQQSGW